MQATVKPQSVIVEREYFYNKENMDKFHSSFNL